MGGGIEELVRLRVEEARLGLGRAYGCGCTPIEDRECEDDDDVGNLDRDRRVAGDADGVAVKVDFESEVGKTS